MSKTIYYKFENFNFEWNEEKEKINIKKHNLSFKEASRIFINDDTKIYRNKSPENEERYIAIGTIDYINTLLVVHAYREIYLDEGIEVIRIISARKLGKNEVKKWQ